MSDPIVVAAAQTAPVFRAKAENLASIIDWTRRAHDLGAGVVVFPECSLTGYCYDNRGDAEADAEEIPGPVTDRLAAVAAELGVAVAVGLVECAGRDLYNAAVLVDGTGVIGHHRKCHLPWEAVDRFVRPGDFPLRPIDTAWGRLGLLICYDLRFPEPARVLALAGVEVIINLTNLPLPGQPQPDFFFQTRAAENRVWLVAADRVGVERGVRFIGQSSIVDPAGRLVARGSESEEELVIAEVDVSEARRKDLVFESGVYELHLFSDRRPDLYGPLTVAGKDLAGKTEPDARRATTSTARGSTSRRQGPGSGPRSPSR